MPIDKATPNMVGCIIDGVYEQYAVAAMILFARNIFNYDDPTIVTYANEHINSMANPGYPHYLTDREYEVMIEESHTVEQWLNEHCAEEGYEFGWKDGEFFYQSNKWWQDD